MPSKIKNSGLPNFKGLQIQLQSQLNIPLWEDKLKDYWDQQLVLLLKYCFPLDFDYTNSLHSTVKNHKSAMGDPTDVEKYRRNQTQSHKCPIHYTTYY